jgi:hypothetical protein
VAPIISTNLFQSTTNVCRFLVCYCYQAQP